MGKIYLTSSQLHINIHAETHIQTQSSAFSLGFSLPSIIRPGFLPIGKHPFFLHCLRLSAILCGPRLNSARGQEYPHMAHLNGTGHIDHRHPALKIQRGSATAPLIHSLALTRPRNQQRERNTRAREAASVMQRRTVGVEKQRLSPMEQTSDVKCQINGVRYQPGDKNCSRLRLNIQRWWWRGRNSLEVIKMSQQHDW